MDVRILKYLDIRNVIFHYHYNTALYDFQKMLYYPVCTLDIKLNMMHEEYQMYWTLLKNYPDIF